MSFGKIHRQLSTVKCTSGIAAIRPRYRMVPYQKWSNGDLMFTGMFVQMDRWRKGQTSCFSSLLAKNGIVRTYFTAMISRHFPTFQSPPSTSIETSPLVLMMRTSPWSTCHWWPWRTKLFTISPGFKQRWASFLTYCKRNCSLMWPWKSWWKVGSNVFLLLELDCNIVLLTPLQVTPIHWLKQPVSSSQACWKIINLVFYKR